MNAELEPEQVKAMKFLVKQSPVCEVNDIVDFLSTLAGSRDLLVQSSEIMNAFRKWYETHRYHIVLPDGRKVMVSSKEHSGQESEDPRDLFTYYDIAQQLVFNFDPLNPSDSQVVSEGAMEVPANDLSAAIIPAVGKYVKKAYADSQAIYSVHYDADEDQIDIDISCLNFKHESFWSGSWLSIW